ncbi:hypothetical protein [Vibrio breoganii]|uniref:hypothetical protein n=1 Tax=Vibrio breoganii TaxID=553239 RepID=UPI00031B922B|nr:hypothetical protein [Vibrio breoganii]OED89074.1 hypothetical protein A1QE_07050 [Vibrio breoganii ZF-55]
MNQVVLFVLMLLYLTPLVIRNFTVTFPVILIIILYYIFQSFRIKTVINRASIFVFLMFVLVFIINLIMFAYHGYQDDYLIRSSFVGLFLLAGGIALVSIYRNIYKEKYIFLIFKHIVYAAIFNCIVGMLVLYFADLRDVIYSFVNIADNAKIHLEQGYRTSGLFYSGVSSLSLYYCCVLFLYLTTYRSKTQHNIFGHNKTVLSFIAFGLLVIGIIYAGRLGLLVLILVFLLALCFGRKFIGIERHLVVRYIGLGLLLSIPIVFVYWSSLQKVILWAFELFIPKETGEVRSRSLDILLNQMIIFPRDLLLGDGSIGRDNINNYVSTDIGYLLLLFMGGIPVLLSYIFLFIILLYTTYSSRYEYIRYPAMFSVMLIVIGNFKDAYIFTSSGLGQLCLILVVVSCFENKLNWLRDEK